MVGFAKTATIRARDPVGGPSYMQKRLDYLDYVAAAPRPSIVVIEDKDEPPGYGAFWGEVQTNVHKALGCLGTVTNGSIRDLAAVAEGSARLSAAAFTRTRISPAPGVGVSTVPISALFSLLEIYDLNAAGSLLTWDQATYMPYGGAVSRGRQSAMLRRLAHELVRGDCSRGCGPPTMFSADRICATISCGHGSIETMIGFSSGPGSSSASN
jgi:hypothetical protein